MTDSFYRRLFGFAAFCGAAGVGFGAFGAHYLKSRIDNTNLETLKTSILYLFVHTLAILAVCIIGKEDPFSRLLRSSGILFGVGILLFTGSLLIISTSTVTGLRIGYFGIITPVGGLCFMAGWLVLLLYSFQKKFRG